MNKPNYIVTERELLSAIKCALDKDISNPAIVTELMRTISINVETVLEDDCDEVTEEMMNAWMLL